MRIWDNTSPGAIIILRSAVLTGIFIAVSGCGSSVPRSSGSRDECGPDGGEEGVSVQSGPALSSIEKTALLRTISEFLGAPYQAGGESDKGIDCSGLTRAVFLKAFSISLPRTTEAQYSIGEKISLKKLLPGDLVFFNTTGRNPSHVGIYVGEGLFAHASLGEGVTLTLLSTPYYCERYSGARRVRP